MKNWPLFSVIMPVFHLTISVFNCAYSQNLITEWGEYQMKIEPNMTESEAKNKCLEFARIDAIRKAFGEVIIQGNSTFIQNTNTGLKTETQNVFNFYSDTYVNGEWVEDKNEPIFNKSVQGNDTWISVKVKCNVRSLKNKEISFETKTASCPEIKCQTEQFNNGQDFFLCFKSPVDGYLSVYLDVPTDAKTYRILPYKYYSAEGSVFVKADIQYTFFSKKNNVIGNSTFVDELTLDLTQPGIPENNKVFVLFSPKEPLGKPLLSNTMVAESNQTTNKGAIELPAYLPSDEFQKWMQKVRRRNPDIELSSKYISIKP
jgi:hypothetical protein